MEIPLRLDEPLSCAITCMFHQVMETTHEELIIVDIHNIVTDSLFTVLD